MDELNKYQQEQENEIENNNVKLHYDYQSYENILNNSLIKTIDLLSQKEDKTKFSNPSLSNNILNSNLNYYKPSKINATYNNNNNVKKPFTEFSDMKNNSFNYIPNLSSKTPQTINNLNYTNINNKIKYNYDDEYKNDDYKKDINDKIYIQNYRNKSYNFNRKRISNNSNIIKNSIISKLEKDLKQKEDDDDNLYEQNLLNNYIDKENENEKIQEYNKINKNIYQENKRFYNTFNNLSDYLITTNIENDTYTHKINDIDNLLVESKGINKNNNIYKKDINIVNAGPKKIKTHKSTPQLCSNLNSDISDFIQNKNYKINLKKFEIIKISYI